MSFDTINRRTALKAAGASLGALAASSLAAADEAPKVNGNIKQSVCYWCYGQIPLERVAAEAKKIGYQSVELLNQEQIKLVKKMGLTCAVMSTAGWIADGLNRKENHDKIIKQLE